VSAFGDNGGTLVAGRPANLYDVETVQRLTAARDVIDAILEGQLTPDRELMVVLVQLVQAARRRAYWAELLREEGA
jgi:hypothetical protein